MSHSLSEWGESERASERALLMLTFLQNEKVYCVALMWERLHIRVDFLTLCRICRDGTLLHMRGSCPRACVRDLLLCRPGGSTLRHASVHVHIPEVVE